MSKLYQAYVKAANASVFLPAGEPTSQAEARKIAMSAVGANPGSEAQVHPVDAKKKGREGHSG